MSTERYELPTTVELNGPVCATSTRPTWCYKVLVAAGNTGPIATAELYDRKRDTWTPTGSLTESRWLHTTTPLKNGKVLVTGGRGADNTSLSSAEIFAPSAV